LQQQIIHRTGSGSLAIFAAILRTYYYCACRF
jgi:hypothetical protein